MITQKKIKIVMFLFLFLLLLFFAMVFLKYTENKQINNVIHTLNDVIYKPVLMIQEYGNENKTDTAKLFDHIETTYPEIRSIIAIKNNEIYFSTNVDKITVTKKVSTLISEDVESNLFNSEIKRNKVNYLFKTKFYYCMISFYPQLLAKKNSNYLTNFWVDDQTETMIDNSRYLLLSSDRYIDNLNINVKSGIKLKKIILVVLGVFLLAIILNCYLIKIINYIFSSEKLWFRDVRSGIDNGEFIPYYQGVYSLDNEKFIAAEVLCRWNKNGVILPPSEFIAKLEKMDEIKEITFLFIKSSFKMLADNNVNDDFMLSFNFSVKMILDDDFINDVIVFVNETPNVKNNIIIELTESEYRFTHTEKIRKIMMRLKKEGILLSIDDLGTGYSNLLTVQELPFDIMKIDRCFISNDFAVSNSNMLEILALLGKEMSLTIVSEGMENTSELDKIKSLDIDLCQGFFFSKPSNSNEFIGSLTKNANHFN